jgi:hypothetical protein
MDIFYIISIIVIGLWILLMVYKYKLNINYMNNENAISAKYFKNSKKQ